ncbi:MAG: YcaQ family DNA glycosylase [Chloroflexi bacterium]|nr:YcaQ family DNA glycosylase [Chloroflexota bacterium]
METHRILSLAAARRLAITKQHLNAPRAPATRENIFEIIRDLGCVQLDPIRAVERSHRLVVFSRVGAYDLSHFDQLIWRDKKFFEYWAHCASIVLIEDYPIHNLMMRDYLKADQQKFKADPAHAARFITSTSAWTNRARKWIRANDELRRTILRRIKREGALPARAFQEDGIGTKHWVSTGWSSGRNVSRMLDFLWLSGALMVAGREGLNKTWDLSERVLPDWTPREKLSAHDLVYRAAQKSLRALGVATPQQIQFHFTRDRYPDLKNILAELARDQKIARVEIQDGKRMLKGEWYLHTDDLPLVEKIERGEWIGRTTLLSPFDNLICDRKRLQLLFDYDFTIEIYTPAPKRKYGYYVLSILHDDQLIGRIDPTMDRAQKRLNVNAVYAERGAAHDAPTARAVRDAIQELAQFLGAREIAYGKKIARAWKKFLC